MDHLVKRKLTVVLAVLLLLSLLCATETFNWTSSAHAATPQAWSPNGVQYKVGDLVIYQGNTYVCIQANTSEPGWDPVDVPALWQLQTGQTTPTPSPTATLTPSPTPSPSPTGTVTPSPTPSPTPPPGAPAKPTISIQKDWNTGNGNYYIITWSK